MAQHPGHALAVTAAGIGIADQRKNLGKMNRKQFILLLVLVVVVGAAGGFGCGSAAIIPGKVTRRR